MKKILMLCAFCLTIGVIQAQILSPFLNDALSLPKGTVQAATGYSHLGVSYDGDRTGMFNTFDFQLGYGFTDKFSLRARYDKAWYVGEMFTGESQNFISLGPAFQLKKDRISLFVPVGATFSSEGDSFWEVTPTVNFSLPLGRIVFFNPAVEVGFTLCEDCSSVPLLGVDLGVGVRATDVMTIYAEYDFVYSLEDFGNGHYNMIGGGIGFKFPGKKTE